MLPPFNRITDRGFGILPSSPPSGSTVWARYYVWDEENRLTRSVEDSLIVDYRYGADGQRAVKYSSKGESLYFDSMWQCQTDYPSLRQMKNIYVGQSRVASQMNIAGDNTTSYETVNTYYYHPDHLGSSQLITDYQGKEYERVEYTAYGESWIEKTGTSGSMITFKFTGKEEDSETGLYYYGARYYNPKTSRWISSDPAMGDYLPVAPVSDEARQHNGYLPGMGGVFNLVNLDVYHYAGNNPVRYTDPDGLARADGIYDPSNAKRDAQISAAIRNEEQKDDQLQRAETAKWKAAQASISQQLRNAINEAIADPALQPNQPQGGDTHCNGLPPEVLVKMGIDSSSLLDVDPATGQPTDTTANSMLQNAAHSGHWVKTTPAEAQRLANGNTPVLAGAKGTVHGHVGIIYPNYGTYDPARGPSIGQAGTANGVYSAAGSGFPGPVEYYYYRADSQ